ENAMTKHRMRERSDVIEPDVIAAMHERARLAAEDHPLSRAHAGAVVDPLLDEVRRDRGLRSRVARDVHRITRHRLRHWYPPDEALELDDVASGHRVRELRILTRRRRTHDVDLLIFRQ